MCSVRWTGSRTKQPYLIRQVVAAGLRDGLVIDENYKRVDGTSFAAPIVTSIVAQMLEANPALGPGEVKRILLRTAQRVPGIEIERQGWGWSAPRPRSRRRSRRARTKVPSPGPRGSSTNPDGPPPTWSDMLRRLSMVVMGGLLRFQLAGIDVGAYLSQPSNPVTMTTQMGTLNDGRPTPRPSSRETLVSLWRLPGGLRRSFIDSYES